MSDRAHGANTSAAGLAAGRIGEGRAGPAQQSRGLRPELEQVHVTRFMLPRPGDAPLEIAPCLVRLVAFTIGNR